jgi:hypothetical protein
MYKTIPGDLLAVAARLFVINEKDEKRPLTADLSEAKPIIERAVEAIVNVIL